ncbi:MAG TPA: integrase family protein [Steroidobacteraceae bacterium]|nr:integrase family protein [Steroidobacteraceae bacterium]
MPLTDSMARNAKPAAKTIRMFDRDGLYLEVSPRGGKWWRLKYRNAGKEKRVSLGVYREVNLKKARARTIEARQLLDAGVDPSENRMGIAKDEMSGHGFRAMARTILDEVLGFRPDFIEHQLAHAVRDPNGRAYNRTAHLEERRKMMQGLGGLLGQAEERR